MLPTMEATTSVRADYRSLDELQQRMRRSRSYAFCPSVRFSSMIAHRPHPLLAFCLLLLVSPFQAQAQYLVGYWHNWNDASAPYLDLSDIDPRYNVIELAFAEPLPGTTSAIEFVPSLEVPQDFLSQIASLRASGRKVLISIGGANATVQLNSEAERDQFVYLTMSMLLTWGVDGLDIDLEGSSVSITGGTIEQPVDSTIIRLIGALEEIMVEYRQATDRKLFLTMAPETAYVQGGMSAYGGIWGAYLPVINALRDSIDLLQVQLYNSGSMYGIDGGIYQQGTADFIVSQTEAVIQGFSTSGGAFAGMPASKVAVGLPACGSAAGGGYTDSTAVRAALEYLLGTGPRPGNYTLANLGGYPDLGGMMTWSINWDAVSACKGAYSYAENFERIFAEVGTGIAGTTANDRALHPVPAADRVYLPQASTSVIITDLNGRVVRTHASGIITEVDVQSLPAGTYLLSWITEGKTQHARFVKE